MQNKCHDDVSSQRHMLKWMQRKEGYRLEPGQVDLFAELHIYSFSAVCRSNGINLEVRQCFPFNCQSWQLAEMQTSSREEQSGWCLPPEPSPVLSSGSSFPNLFLWVWMIYMLKILHLILFCFCSPITESVMSANRHFRCPTLPKRVFYKACTWKLVLGFSFSEASVIMKCILSLPFSSLMFQNCFVGVGRSGIIGKQGGEQFSAIPTFRNSIPSHIRQASPLFGIFHLLVSI